MVVAEFFSMFNETFFLEGVLFSLVRGHCRVFPVKDVQGSHF